MKFSLKKLAAAVVMAAAATGASAAIQDGMQGNGELFFNAWDGASSYTFDMNITIDDFISAYNAPGKMELLWGSDFTSSYSSWLVKADSSLLTWNILSADSLSATRMITTQTPSDELSATQNPGADIRSSIAGINIFLGDVNQAIGSADHLITVGDTSPTYGGQFGGNFGGGYSFDTTGTPANDSYANGLFMQLTTSNATGKTSAWSGYADEDVAVKAWVDADGLHIAAVPEPSETAMLLAGLGLIGFAARRKARRA